MSNVEVEDDYTKKEVLKLTVEDAVKDILYRKDDEELTIDDIADLAESGEVTLCEMVRWFRDELKRHWDGR